MSLPRLVCFDAFDTLVGLDDPAGRLRSALADRGWHADLASIHTAFAHEARLYRRLSLLADTPARLHTVRRACARALLQGLRAVVGPHHDHEDATRLLLDSLEFCLLPGALATLAALRERGLKLALVSNWDCGLPAVLTRLGLTPWFDAVAVSAVVGAEKPDARMWQHVLGPLGVAPHEAWHVGDEVANDIDGARALGLTAVLIGPERPPAGVPRIAALPELLPLLEACA